MNKKLSENFEECSKTIKKKVQFLKQQLPQVKGKTQTGVKAAGRIIEDASNNVINQSVMKSQVYYKNSQKNEVNKMVARVFEKAFDQERRDSEERKLAYSAEELEAKVLKKQEKGTKRLSETI